MAASNTHTSRRPLRIVLLGYLVRGPVGGMAWVSLNYLHGLRALGHDVWFIEDSGDSPWCCYDPQRSVTDADPRFGLNYAANVFAYEGLGDTWAYWDQHTARWRGAGAARAEEICRSADLVLNLSGINPLRAWTADIPHRAFIDTDPAFTQVRHLTDAAARDRADEHTSFFTYGEHFGRPGCTIPDDGLPWIPMRQPIALDRWKVYPARADASFTTIMQWNSYAAPTHEGRHYGMKSESFEPYRELPARSAVPLELALGGSDAPRAELQRAGWRLVDPLKVSLWPWDYQAYVSASAGEFGVAKHGYVSSHSGAFSDRTAAYLASGRPVVVQDTGFSQSMDVGEGLLPFSSPDEAVAALARAHREPERHGRAARAFAEKYFDASVVLREMVDAAMADVAAGARRTPTHAGDR